MLLNHFGSFVNKKLCSATSFISLSYTIQLLLTKRTKFSVVVAVFLTCFQVIIQRHFLKGNKKTVVNMHR